MFQMHQKVFQQYTDWSGVRTRFVLIVLSFTLSLVFKFEVNLLI